MLFIIFIDLNVELYICSLERKPLGYSILTSVRCDRKDVRGTMKRCYSNPATVHGERYILHLQAHSRVSLALEITATCISIPLLPPD